MNARLVELRVNRGLSIADAAEQMGVARGTLVRAERGKSVQTARKKRIADFYEMAVTDLFPLDSHNGDADREAA